ncbi:hypothetical protein NliqN6_4613 [Naganishia liquefaciens]|uniref:Histidinol-phosphatase n=1 Tax=Naganishia liquefaciens TaxID=104408 RepID=A0A8H3YI46_9TREE|nr:hypothetical protein NliqN6_4613 [Naganishia liquefaciens]
MHSHHSHSGEFCRHAAQGTTLEECVGTAIECGLTTLGLSEHCPRYRREDLYPEEQDLTPEDLEQTFLAYLTEAHRLKRLYASQIDLLVGLETDYITQLDLDALERLLEREGERIEYVVGSVHHVAEQGIDFSVEWWKACLAGFQAPSSADPSASNDLPFSDQAITSYLHAYLAAQHTLLTRIQPPVIGHFDLCRLYVPHLPLSDTSRFPGIWDAVVRNVKEVIAYGGMFEVSAASFRKGWEDGYPGKDVLQCIIAHKGRLCLSDDSHGPQAVTQNYARLRAYLIAQNVTELWYLASVDGQADAGQEQNQGMSNPRRRAWTWLDPVRRRVIPRRYEGSWAEDDFWTQLEDRQRAIGRQS